MIGYSEDFLLGIRLPLPSFSIELEQDILMEQPQLRHGMIADYINYSVVMNDHPQRRSAAFTALNLDQNLLKSAKRRDNWRNDPRIGFENQLNNDYYRNNVWDRGHMVRRANAAWGDSQQQAQRASNETFYYSNSCLQHANLNQDEWLALEDWVKALDLDIDGRITSFSGPFYSEHDRVIEPNGRELARIPCGFFKVVCFVNKDTKSLDVRAFVMYQDVDSETIADKSGRKKYNNQTYQVTVAEVERLTGLEFADEIYEANPLIDSLKDPNNQHPQNIVDTPEYIEVAKPKDIVASTTSRQTIKDDVVDIFITAAMVNPKGADRQNEWVSIANLGAEDVDLSGWKLMDNSAQPLAISSQLDGANLVIKPGESRVIGPVLPLQLANKGDVIILLDNNDSRIDWVNYTKRMVEEGIPVLFVSPRDTLV